MTNEQAKAELMQIYGMLSEEKKQAIDVLMAQNCDQCEVGNPCLYCEHEFKEQADTIPVMYYPQVDGITPTVVAQADGEKNCFNCKWYPDNGITKGFDEVCHKCSNSDKWEGLIKRAPWEDIAPQPKIPEAQADGEYILKKDVMGCIGQTSLHWELARKLRKLPSVAISNKVGHWMFHEIEDTLRWYECDQCGTEAVKEYDYCHGCGARMESKKNE